MKSLFLFLGCALASFSAAACSSPSKIGNDNTGGTGNSSCPPEMGDELIADFATDNGLHPADGRSGGFYVYGDMLGAFDPPKDGDNPYPIDSANGNATCSGAGSFRVKAAGFRQWGAAAGADFVPRAGSYKGTYDASKYKGVGFWAKGGAPVTRVQVSFPDVYTDQAANPTPLDASTSPCVYTAGATNNCSPYLVKFGDPDFPKYMAATIDTTWKYFYVLFADTKQDKNNAGFHRMNADYVDLQHLTGMAIQVNAIYAASGVATANDFELWIDDVMFIK